ncbi:NAD(+) synthase [uncultured Eubacterium sp.]|uniref:NAD(+) synthase n=1 Tax=uncultured Eubacterium sp. TaxID=165185 RepID=UPI0025DB44C6|nr:NAD(+) synthase [uncultured Eubacterium sp.]
MNYGMFRVAAASLKLKVGCPSYNKVEIKKAIYDAEKKGVRLLVTPELSITGYTCADLFFTKSLLNASKEALYDITEYTKDKEIVVIVGAPLPYKNAIYNCAFVLYKGVIQLAVPKQNIANYNEFYEKRWFESGKNVDEYIEDVDHYYQLSSSAVLKLTDEVTLGIELCEDLWVAKTPSSDLALGGANIIVNLSASDEYVSKARYRRDLIANQSARCICGYVYAGASVLESTTDLVFSGATVIAENGAILAEGKRFSRNSVITIADIDCEKLNTLRQKNTSFTATDDSIEINELSASIVLSDDDGDEDEELEYGDSILNPDNDLAYRYVDPHPFVPGNKDEVRERCEEIFAIQASGLAKRLEHIGSTGCVIGISGGLDSTLALLVSVEAMKLLGKPVSNIMGITMPGFGTTDRTYTNAIELMKSLGVEIKEISIKDACIGHLKDIEHSEDIKDITYENTQARERTQILFDMANKHNRLLVGTGDLSELAMGWCTYNGDHMSMYGVNASVPKTLVRYLVEYVAVKSDEKTRAILLDILDTPVSPELLPPDENGKIAQKTEDNIGPYELHDFFLYNFVRFGFTKEKIQKLAEKAFDGVYEKKTIGKWLDVFMKRFFISQFKRSCIPDGPKVGSVSLSPRGDWRMPSDACFDDYI